MMEKQSSDGWIDNSISVMQLNIGRLEVNCFDEDAEMSIRVGKSSYQSLSVDEAKELASFIVSHIKNETDANPEFTPPPAPIKTEGEDETEIDKAIRCLSLELPYPVWKDVNEKWQRFKAGFAPHSPVGIDVEALAKTHADNVWNAGGNIYLMIIESFKAGYSSSLPQSSTEEEKDLWPQVLSDIINILYKSNGTGSGAIYVVKLLKSKYKISKR